MLYTLARAAKSRPSPMSILNGPTERKRKRKMLVACPSWAV